MSFESGSSTKRQQMLKFWSQYSHSPTVESMMLCKDAQDFCEDDRIDILSSLPGIGRFTGALARTAQHLHVTDFIEAFVLKNFEDHKHLSNVSFETTDAASLELERESVDFVFTNWLLMYLVDSEVIQFLKIVLRGLRVGGSMHVRESCTERSTRKPKDTGSIVQNPTSYRHISQYLELFKAIRWFDDNSGNYYGFKILWAKSVPTYIELKNNWRQVHWLVEKREIADCTSTVLTTAELIDVMLQAEKDQTTFDNLLDTAQILFDGHSPFERILNVPALSYLTKCDLNANAVKYFRRLQVKSPSYPFAWLFQRVGLQAGIRDDQGIINVGSTNVLFGVSSFLLSETFNCCVVGVESNFYAFSTLLGQCNKKLDKRIRYQYAELDVPMEKNKTIHQFALSQKAFDFGFAVNLISSTTNQANVLSSLRDLMKENGQIFLLEFDMGVDGLTVDMLKTVGFKVSSIANVSAEVSSAMSESISAAKRKIAVMESNNEPTLQDSTRLIEAWKKLIAINTQWNLIVVVKA